MNAAHLKLHGIAAVIVPIDKAQELTEEDLTEIRDHYQLKSQTQMLLGHVLLVWQKPDGDLGCFGDHLYRDELLAYSWTEIHYQLNVELV